jgi:hypothetical protein
MIELALLSKEGFVECPMPGEPVFVGTRLIRANPLDEVVQILVLFLAGAEFFRLPGP